jgi:hypothetical protein
MRHKNISTWRRKILMGRGVGDGQLFFSTYNK